MSINPLVLIIEDNDNIRNFVSIVLTTHNFKVDKAKTGKEGLSLFTSHSPDIILLDLGLPDIDGLDVLKRIREKSSTPIIVNTARSNEQDMIMALDLGADYIKKPFTTKELLSRIQTAITMQL
ncbi:response regulator [Ruminiclostridium papyrosolvens]|uniref:Stage 0 sporulation protein A homolog n=1 Tax=Ruminiclostridium papyrosolvens C7 TaxID=1330534 RepID=U4QZZ0_9FIRM|nr:response regulator [Ruminiclostridium papyrosolvens]EPR10431.1 chemotaxis protein CheY [Ruminiclostridium papyrosolvens C7]